MSENDISQPTRRNLFYGVAAAGVALPVLAACGSSSSSDSGSSGGGSSSGHTYETSEIPVGGGTIFANDEIVVTQPVAGTFEAFSAICTHQGCTVSSVKDGTIDCACHGSMYSIKTGAVEGGPAPAPLPKKSFTVTGTSITVS
ncbi:MAG TPA: Rieske (2Fe-2S) protein [Marmoricola sp.]|jgi:Rieske Fe-S protein|nr:Rieske (2Fe-2S) protein [Marmoricola sp.]